MTAPTGKAGDPVYGSEGPPVFVVLGATGGIGGSLARKLAAGGARLMLAARRADPLERLAGELGALHASLDATSLEEVQECVEDTKRHYGRVSGIANCVGSLLLKPAHLTSREEWDATLAQNLGSAFSAVRAGARSMREGGSVVLVSSAAARVGLANHEAIAASKAGIEGLVRSAAATYGARGLRVNAVAPGLTRSPLTERITSSETAAEASRAMHVMGRLGEPRDVASAIAWLLDPEQSWVTGQVIGVDGGLATVRTQPRPAPGPRA